MKKIKINEENNNQRIDVFLSINLGVSRSTITKHIKTKDITVNKNTVKPGYILKVNDLIEISSLEDKIKFEAEDIKLKIYYEDDDLMVVFKPSGMVVHPGCGNNNHTLVNALLNYTKNLSNINGEFRPGIVHRIDKDTSGLLLISKNNEIHEKLSNAFKNKTIKREYIALVSGIINETNGKIDAPIGRDKVNRKKFTVTKENSKKAITNFTVLERYKNSCLVRLKLETGRTHQIRVHMAYIGHPVINDQLYKGVVVDKSYGQMLHAEIIGFIHPRTNKYLEFSCECEPKFKEILEKFKN